MENLKKRTLATQAKIATASQAKILQNIQTIENLTDCKLSNRHIRIEYDLQKTALKDIIPQLRSLLANHKHTLRNNLIDKISTALIHCSETNQQDNLNILSSGNLRLQKIHIAVWQAQKNHHNNQT